MRYGLSRLSAGSLWAGMAYRYVIVQIKGTQEWKYAIPHAWTINNVYCENTLKFKYLTYSAPTLALILGPVGPSEIFS